MSGAARVGCGAAILREGRLLLVKRRTPPEAQCWSLPGGKVDFRERAEDAARREIREELGVEIALGPLLCLAQMPGQDGEHWVAPVYRAHLTVGEPRICEPAKHSGLGWFALDAMPAPLAEPARQAAEALRANL